MLHTPLLCDPLLVWTIAFLGLMQLAAPLSYQQRRYGIMGWLHILHPSFPYVM
jgi:hypothetical protein